MKIIDGKKISEEILAEIKKETAQLSFQPIFTDVLVGDDLASTQYVRKKAKTAEAVGIQFRDAHFPAEITTEELIREIQVLNKIPNMCGIIVQLPLPEHLDRQKVLDSIDSELDVDCLGKIASQKFFNNESGLGYPTALACLKILDSLNLDLSNRKIVVLGQGTLVGRPVAHLLRSRGLSVETANSRTENISALLREADVIISGIGQGKFIDGTMIKKGAIIIDAGTSEENGAVVGDVDFESVQNVAGYLTPSPGGVGPVTVAMLLDNVLKVAKSKEKEYE
jgi:methylenetetrahydrofolate dehydrogenase (NADP+)/methenyltetrahydrofolate cyclohydrolase